MKTEKPVSFCEISGSPWKSALSKYERIWFMGMVELTDPHFILGTPDGIYSVTIPRRAPFRVVDEGYLIAFHKSLPPLKKTNQKYTPTWKMKETPFLKELDSTMLFHGVPEAKRFSYFIATEDECLEFISSPPKFKFFKQKKIKEVIKLITDQELKSL